MGLPDTYDVMWQCDRWLLLGAPRLIPNQLYAAVEEQGWKPDEFLPELLEHWVQWANQQAQLAESASYNRGYGWRVWRYSDVALHPSELVEYSSLDWTWKAVPGPVVGGVVYIGPLRRILAGRDPFYLEHGLPRIRPSGGLPNHRPYDSLHAKEGAWVTDEQMGQFRKKAILAFGLEG